VSYVIALQAPAPSAEFVAMCTFIYAGKQTHTKKLSTDCRMLSDQWNNQYADSVIFLQCVELYTPQWTDTPCFFGLISVNFSTISVFSVILSVHSDLRSKNFEAFNILWFYCFNWYGPLNQSCSKLFSVVEGTVRPYSNGLEVILLDRPRRSHTKYFTIFDFDLVFSSWSSTFSAVQY
jgi:hypothetical protein